MSIEVLEILRSHVDFRIRLEFLAFSEHVHADSGAGVHQTNNLLTARKCGLLDQVP